MGVGEPGQAISQVIRKLKSGEVGGTYPTLQLTTLTIEGNECKQDKPFMDIMNHKLVKEVVRTTIASKNASKSSNENPVILVKVLGEGRDGR